VTAEPRAVATDVGFTEGPVVSADGSLLFTSMDRGKLYRQDDGVVTTWAVVGSGPNGAAAGADGTVYVAQNGGVGFSRTTRGVTAGVQMTSGGGEVTYLTRDPLAPNDLCFGPDGLLYVTDPTRGSTFDDGRIWRCDVSTAECELLATLPWYPNGVGFGSEDDAIYVASTGDGRVVRFALESDGRLGHEETVLQIDGGHPDGFAFDDAGNIVIASIGLEGGPSEIHTWTIEGRQLDVLRPGSSRYYTNVALSRDRTLFITDSDGGRVLAVDDWPHRGLPLHPFR
jgi:gluconolactonase